MNEPTRQVATLPAPADMTPMQMLQVAVQNGVDTEQIKQLMELQREWKADRAREAFVQAMSDFRSESIKIIKHRGVRYDGELKYKYASLGDILEIVVPKLSEHQLSHRWETKQDGPLITATCIITHVLGHSEQATLSASPDPSGGKNNVQAIGSSVMYLQRYTFLAATGLATKDEDDDGRGSEPPESITAEQANEIEKRIDAIKTSRPVFMRWLGVDELIELPAKRYDQAMRQLDVLAKKAR